MTPSSKKPKKQKRPTLTADRILTGSAPKRRVFTREEQRRARDKTKPEGPQDDERNVSTKSRYT